MEAKAMTTPALIGEFILSIFINALGNALTVSLNLGSAFWTASAANMSHALPISLGNMLVLNGLFIIILNAILLHKIEWRRIAGNLLFMIPFSYLIGWFDQLMLMTPLNHLNLFVRILLDFVGVAFIGTGISIYQRINVMLHPADDLMQILRFDYFHGNATAAQITSFMPPLIAIAITFFFTHQIYAVNIGTIFALLFQGAIVAWADKHIIPSLKHRNLSRGEH